MARSPDGRPLGGNPIAAHSDAATIAVGHLTAAQKSCEAVIARVDPTRKPLRQVHDDEQRAAPTMPPVLGGDRLAEHSHAATTPLDHIIEGQQVFETQIARLYRWAGGLADRLREARASASSLAEGDPLIAEAFLLRQTVAAWIFATLALPHDLSRDKDFSKALEEVRDTCGEAAHGAYFNQLVSLIQEAHAQRPPVEPFSDKDLGG